MSDRDQEIETEFDQKESKYKINISYLLKHNKNYNRVK